MVKNETAIEQMCDEEFRIITEFMDFLVCSPMSDFKLFSDDNFDFMSEFYDRLKSYFGDEDYEETSTDEEEAF